MGTFSRSNRDSVLPSCDILDHSLRAIPTGHLLLLLLLLSRFSRVRLCATPQTAAYQAPRPWDSPGKNTGVGCHFLLQCRKVKSESEVAQMFRLLAAPWTAACQAPPSMGFSRQEYGSGVPSLSPQDTCRPSQVSKCAILLFHYSNDLKNPSCCRKVFLIKSG